MNRFYQDVKQAHTDGITKMSLLTFYVTSIENYKSLEFFRKIDYGLKSFQAGIDSIRPRSPYYCKSPQNELMKL